MKRSFFGPTLFLGVALLLGGYCGMWSSLQQTRANEGALSAFIARYQDGDDYAALLREAVAIHEEANFLQSEYTGVPAFGVVGGVFLIPWAFERRKMFRKFTEMKLQLDNTSRLMLIAQKEAQSLPSRQPGPISDSSENLPTAGTGAAREP